MLDAYAGSVAGLRHGWGGFVTLCVTNGPGQMKLVRWGPIGGVEQPLQVVREGDYYESGNYNCAEAEIAKAAPNG